MYYGEDNSDQWKKKKQTKAEAKAAKISKLDPDSELNRNAKEVMDERAARNKRKLQEMQEEEDKEEAAGDDEGFAGVQRELPGQGLRNKDYKKQKTADPLDTVEDVNPAEMSQTQLMRMAKKEAKKDKRAEKKAKKAEKKAAKMEAGNAADNGSAAVHVPEAEASKKPAETKTAKSPAAKKASKKQQNKVESKDVEPANNDHDRDENDSDGDEYETVDEGSDGEGHAATADLNPLDISGLKAAESSDASSPTSTPNSTFDTATGANPASAEAVSATTSTSSTVPPSEKPKHIKLPADTSALRARLAARIEALRAARKADGPDGKPIRTRQELIEARRAKQAQRKEHKKELRNRARLEEEAKREEALASNSPSVMSPRVGLGDDDDEPANFAFGRVAFDDGTKLSHDLTYALSAHKKRGPSDPKTALLKIQNQKKRLAALDKEKQAEIAEKEQWLTARKRAEGERIRDDEHALKKAVKRKDQAKKKSEKAWKERSDGVAKSIRDRQKKREENIKKRKDDKLAHKLGRKSGKKVGGGAKKARPGFEGSFGGGKKKK
ncbi:putative surfeit locus protein 6 [Colletotrichum sublineola]|uniref:Putative surfeit locus protein 6 n=1 Tax=Colletotrichum sublineola TaxID=1173701 RepID=A0A066WZ89_COLSU|nr:putative surfeit locus protein 6 [Colletotrichum sublineola]